MKNVIATLFLFASAYSIALDKSAQYISVVNCGNEVVARANEIGKIYESHPLDGIEDLAYLLDKKTVFGMGTARVNVDRDGIIKWKPAVALTWASGWLAGSFHKDLGGELVYINANKEAKLILDRSVFDIFKTSAGVIVFTAGSLFGDQRNEIYLLKSTEDGFESIKIFSLPGVPVSTWRLADGGILVNVDTSSFVLSDQLELYRVKCTRELIGG